MNIENVYMYIYIDIHRYTFIHTYIQLCASAPRPPRGWVPVWWCGMECIRSVLDLLESNSGRFTNWRAYVNDRGYPFASSTRIMTYNVTTKRPPLPQEGGGLHPYIHHHYLKTTSFPGRGKHDAYVHTYNVMTTIAYFQRAPSGWRKGGRTGAYIYTRHICIRALLWYIFVSLNVLLWRLFVFDLRTGWWWGSIQCAGWEARNPDLN